MVDGKSIYRVVLNLEISRHTLARYVKLHLEGQAIFELKTKFSHQLVFNKNEESETLFLLFSFSHVSTFKNTCSTVLLMGQ